MAVSGNLQNKIAPPAPNRAMDFSQAGTKSNPTEKIPGANPQVDFRSVLQNSNSDTTRERAARKSGDLSGAKSDDEFYKALNDRMNPTRVPKNQMDKDDFLKLFIAQMQNQDPLAPQDNSQMAAQLAQFNGLEQMMNVNKTLEHMLKSQGTDRSLNMINYVGKEVSLSNGILKFDGKNLTKATFENEFPVSDAILEVRNSGGKVVAESPIGNLMAGEHPLKWDGKDKEGKVVNPGTYSFAILAKGQDGAAVPVNISSKVKISGIDIKDEAGSLYTEIGKIKITDIASVGAAGFGDVPKVGDVKKELEDKTKQEVPKIEGTDKVEQKVAEKLEIPVENKMADPEKLDEKAEKQEPAKAEKIPPGSQKQISGIDDKLNPMKRDMFTQTPKQPEQQKP